jgi:hypothetical protein
LRSEHVFVNLAKRPDGTCVRTSGFGYGKPRIASVPARRLARADLVRS